MAKKKKRNKKKQEKQAVHYVPDGFWRQTWAVLLIVVSILLVLSWFNTGGPVILWAHEALTSFIGLATYVLPALLIYLAFEIFRNEYNRLSMAVKVASFLELIWLAGFFGLIGVSHQSSTGGFVGDMINSGVLLLVNPTVAAFIYVVLIFITLLYVLGITLSDTWAAVWGFLRPSREETLQSVKEEKVKSGKKAEFKLNAGVPMVDSSVEETKTKPKRSSLKNSTIPDKAAEEKVALVTISDPNWKPPALSLLEKKQSPADAGNVEQNAEIIKETLHEFNIDVEMEGANIGPKVTQYTLRPPSGVKLTRITALETNIALNLAAQTLRMEAPIPGQKLVGIEVPNRKAADVRLHGILSSEQWKKAIEEDALPFAIGKDISGNAVVADLGKMPHMLIAGQTGSGKSVMINALLTSLLYNNSPSDMKLILVDPKRVEMMPYADIPHLLTEVITEPEKTISALKWSVNEMERRYNLMAEHKVRDIKSYNNKIRSNKIKIPVEDENGIPQRHQEGAMPYIVIVIDELSDLMMAAARDVESYIVRLAQKARAVGIHLVLATQRPSVDVITGLIKANVPARIAFTVASQVDSRTILDQIGAEKLLGQGDMLFITPSMSKPKRIQGAWVTDEEVAKVTDHLKMQSPPQYNNEVVSLPVQLNGKGGVVMDIDNGDGDAMLNDAIQVVLDMGKASTSLLQRRLRVGYARAARIMEEMEERGIVGPPDGSRPREILISSLDELDADDTEADSENNIE